MKWIDRPERALVTPLQLLSNRYAQPQEVSNRWSCVDQLPDIEVPLTATIDDVRETIREHEAFKALLAETHELSNSQQNFGIRLWLKSRLLRGRLDTLKSLRVKVSFSFCQLFVSLTKFDSFRRLCLLSCQCCFLFFFFFVVFFKKGFRYNDNSTCCRRFAGFA